MDERNVRVDLDGGFLGSYEDLIRDKVLPYQWKAMNDEIPGVPASHSIGNFRTASGRSKGLHRGMVFQDSDLYKWLEAVGNILRRSPDGAASESLRERAAEAVDLIVSAQLPDGYLNTYFIVNAPGRRWKNLRDAHELYCSGHLIEAAVSLSRAGEPKLLDPARRLADLIDATFGTGEGRIRGIPGHEEIELALMKLYRHTGERRYLDLALYFVNERGRSPSWFELEAEREDFVPVFGANPLEYYQAHMPVRDQGEAVGHAVRAMYLYCAMADLALETGDGDLAAACERLWENATSRKMYVTGGIGSSWVQESFGAEYDLPNDTAYAETCAAIGLFLFSSRMLRLRGDSKYADTMERCLYNGIPSGLSLDGESYFYVNPLEVIPRVCDGNPSYRTVKYRRQPWYGCACCPPNLARTLSSVGDHAYRLAGDTLFADLYHRGTATFDGGGRKVSVRQTTDYPRSGTIRFEMLPEAPVEFAVAVRVPGWCGAPVLKVDGMESGTAPDPDGYFRVRKTWKRGDRLDLELPMETTRVRAHPRVRADYGKVAVMRGPVVYCLEEVDNGPGLFTVRLPAGVEFGTADRLDLPGGMPAIIAEGESPAERSAHRPLYGTESAGTDAIRRELLFVPYFAWANRTPGEMAVWLRE